MASTSSGGIRRGTDVLKALALGAHVVMVGGLAAMALAADGGGGVYIALRLVEADVTRSMLLAGRPNLASIDRSLLKCRGNATKIVNPDGRVDDGHGARSRYSPTARP